MSTTMTRDYQEMSAQEIRDLAAERGIEIGDLKRLKIISLLREWDKKKARANAPETPATASAFTQKAPHTNKDFQIKKRADTPYSEELWEMTSKTRAAILFARSVLVKGEFEPCDIDGNRAILSNAHRLYNSLSTAAWNTRNGKPVDWEAIESLLSEIAPAVKE